MSLASEFAAANPPPRTRRRGVAELHVYQRMLTAKGLELFFTATRDNIEIRSVRGRYRKR